VTMLSAANNRETTPTGLTAKEILEASHRF
jgi:hypothetical protein